MEPDVIRMYSSSPPPMEDGAEEEDDDFGDFGTFSGVPNSISFTEFETPTNFNQTQALTATSPPELLNSRGVIGVNGTHGCSTERPKTNGSALSERTEIKKVISSSQDCSVEDTSSGELTACNGVSAQVLTNGFDEQGSPSSQSSVHCHMETENPTIDGAAGFADFAAFSETEGSLSQMEGMGVDAYSVGECTVEQEVTSEETIRDINRTGSPFCDTNWQPCIDAEFQRDITDAEELAASLCTNNNLALNGTDAACSQDSDISPDAADIETGHSDEKGSGNETETETETSFGRLLSTDALEEYGDMSTTGSAPSPPLQGEPSTPADHSQLAEDDEDEDFGDFGEANSFGAQGFGECNHAPEAGQQEQSRPENSVTELEVKNTEENDEEFGDFNTPKLLSGGREGEDEDGFTKFPASDSFGNFSSAVIAASAVEDNVGWSAFGEEEHQMEGESWATFNTEQSSTERQEDGMCEENEEKEEEEGRQSRGTKDEQETSRTDAQMVSLLGRLQKLFQNSFPLNASVATSAVQEVTSLKNLLEPPAGAAQLEGEEDSRWSCDACVRGVWTQLQDVNEAVGLRYQWGGSHCNKALLCCLGIDTRNILFTGQRKQPVIVPMYAASLGMLEPTKEPVKPVSAAEMIAAIAMTMACPSDAVQQEALPPVQFDWSSSGLTNPLDGSSLLNLDFFGSDDEFTCSSTLPGVDPELYELTTSKLDTNTSSGSRVADAFARLMSTMEKTSTSTRKPRKEENLSEEAEKVISALPDLSFMQAKVLMFPSTLTPLNCRD